MVICQHYAHKTAAGVSTSEPKTVVAVEFKSIEASINKSFVKKPLLSGFSGCAKEKKIIFSYFLVENPSILLQ